MQYTKILQVLPAYKQIVGFDYTANFKPSDFCIKINKAQKHTNTPLLYQMLNNNVLVSLLPKHFITSLVLVFL